MALLIVLMGVSGCGKTSVGHALSKVTSLPFFDADDFHSEANKKKMQAGIPLEDKDRIPWLEALNKLCKSNQERGIILACSALKRSYRDLISKDIQIEWVYLKGSFELIHSRMSQRIDHFMPSSLLESQFKTLEEPEDALVVSIDQPLESIVLNIQKTTMKSAIGLIGLGVMGTSLARNIARNNYSISLYNRYVKGSEEGIADKKIEQFEELSSAKGFENLKEFVISIERPRKLILMLTAGDAVDQVIDELAPLLDEGDLIIDAGNSHYNDSQRRYDSLAKQHLNFLGLGVSGGELGALEGPSLMPGGSKVAYELVEDILKAIAAKTTENKPTSAYVGDGGSGHFVKMVHNGIEYAEMQLIAELFEMMHRGMRMDYTRIATVFEDWNKGELGSYLLGISVDILRTKDENGYVIDRILDKASHKGTGAWSLIAAAELGQASSLIASALFSRYTSSKKRYRTKLSELYPAKNNKLELSIEDLKASYSFARIINHHQGLSLIHVASKKNSWDIDLGVVCGLWTEGCIIKSKLLHRLKPVLDQNLLPLSYESIVKQINKNRSSVEEVLSVLVKSDIPSPSLTAAFEFFKQLIQKESSAHIIQAQRDFFGAHGFELRSDSSSDLHHYKWNK